MSAGALLFGPPHASQMSVASTRLVPALLLGILRKLQGRSGAEERLLQQLARACLSLAGNGSMVVISADLLVLRSDVGLRVNTRMHFRGETLEGSVNTTVSVTPHDVKLVGYGDGLA